MTIDDDKFVWCLIWVSIGFFALGCYVMRFIKPFETYKITEKIIENEITYCVYKEVNDMWKLIHEYTHKKDEIPNYRIYQ